VEAEPERAQVGAREQERADRALARVDRLAGEVSQASGGALGAAERLGAGADQAAVIVDADAERRFDPARERVRQQRVPAVRGAGGDDRGG
jgi:hypothetical protein